MSLKAGQLRHRITLEAPVYTQDPVSGEMVRTWEDRGSVWAAIEPLSVREFIQAQAIQSQVSVRFMIRYREDVQPDWRIVHKGKFYNPAGFLADKWSGLEYLTIPASEGVNEG